MSHEHHHSEHKHHEHQPPRKRPIHHDWRFWVFSVAVVLMLVAMVFYVMTDDESLAPGGEAQPVPAAAS